ncbi:MAG: hypothetical protein FJ009_02885 [Chloroflexi bacterium]|nr:hypothetical protein [Chloroflexota bacterium]
MHTQVTVTLPSELYEHAKRWATLTRRDLSETLADALALVLNPMSPPVLEKPIATLSERQILALCQAQLKPSQGRRLTELLSKQREGTLSEKGRRELLALMQTYNQLWIRQSEALAEAVRRGLRQPLES